jgi:hypothetical protein
VIEVKEKPPWTLEISIWAPRGPEYVDSSATRRIRLEALWQRSKFLGLQKYILRNWGSGGGEGEGGAEGDGAGDDDDDEGAGLAVVAKGAGENADDEKKMAAVHAALWRHHHVFFSIFDFYSTMGGGFDGMMTMNPCAAPCLPTLLLCIPHHHPISFSLSSLSLSLSSLSLSQLSLPQLSLSQHSISALSPTRSLPCSPNLLPIAPRYAQLCEEFQLAFKESKHCHKSDLDRVFIAADTASNKVTTPSTPLEPLDPP